MNREENLSLVSESESSTSASSSTASPVSNQSSGDAKKKNISFGSRIKDHVTLGKNLSETMKGKLKLGVRIVAEGGRKNIFKKEFGVGEGEELFKASQCYLSTTAGPVAGELFTSNQKIAFCSDEPVSFRSSSGEGAASLYKVSIPLKKIKSVNRSENVDEPRKKYIYIVTEDDHEFWFMAFLRYEKAFKNLQKAMDGR